MSALPKQKLMVIIPDRLSDLIAKGEITERYYNPGNLFAEVHIVMTNDDHPDVALLRKTVGDAVLHVHNLPTSHRHFVLTLGWRPWLLGRWVRRGLALAEQIGPALIRCHGARLNAFLTSRIKKTLGIPYVVSMHVNPEADMAANATTLAQRLFYRAMRDIERAGLQNADLVMPVYRDICTYLDHMGVSRYRVCYNVLNPSAIAGKTDYRLHSPVRVASVGRQFREKNPENIIRAIAGLNNVHLTMIGDGVLHEYLQTVAVDCGVADKVSFRRSIANDELCRSLPEFDIFAAHNEYWGIPKAVLEPLLTGLPVIVNRRTGNPIAELTRDICELVENTPEGYRSALKKLIADDTAREALGRAAYETAQRNWAPEKTEAEFANVYRTVLGLPTP